MTVRSATLVMQVLVSGTVIDGLTGVAPLGELMLELIDQITGEPVPLSQKVQKDGRFAFFGAPRSTFTLLASEEFRLRVVASADNYQEASVDFSFGPAAGQPAEVEVPMTAVGIEDPTITLFNGGGLPKSGIELVLVRNQVALTGKVHRSGERSEGIDAASVEVLTSSETVADADGNFEMPQPLPLALSVEISAEAPGFESARVTYEPDYSKPINYLTIALRPTP
ncbi:MAG: hypothetical protein IIA92_04475 [Chloroflexi bacterium]|nr:hypothetical protein [Chloroflexota bacterium]